MLVFLSDPNIPSKARRMNKKRKNRKNLKKLRFDS